MSMTAQYPAHPLAARRVRKQTPRKVAWRMVGTAEEAARAAALIEARK
jgi:hypothetical protein